MNARDLIWKYAVDVGVDVLLHILLIDRLVRLFHGGKVKGNGESESMNEQLQFFSTPPSFDTLLTQCWRKFGWPISLKGRFGYGKERAHYVLMALSCEEEWKNYKEVVKSSSVRCLEVVVDKVKPICAVFG